MSEDRALLTAVLGSTRSLVLVVDGEGTVRGFNRSCEEASGYQSSEVLGLKFSELPFVAADAGAETEASGAGGSAAEGVGFRRAFPWAWVSRQGTRRPLSWVATPLGGDSASPGSVVWVGEPLSQRRPEPHECVARLAEATTDLVAVADAEGRLVYMNRAGRSHLGLGPGDDLGVALLRDLFTDWAAEVVTREGIPAALGRGSWAGETALLGSHGRALPVSQVILAHRDDRGSLEFVSTIARDISERKRIEEGWRLGKEAAEAACRGKGEFFANLAQDMRTPILDVIAACDGLRESAPAPGGGEPALGALGRAAHHLLALLDHTLDRCEPEFERPAFQAVPTALRPFLSSVVGPYQGRARARGLGLKAEALGSLPGVLSFEPGRVRQVLSHVVSNAIKFSEGGAVDVRVRYEAGPEPEGWLTFEVRDRGVGLPAPEVARFLPGSGEAGALAPPGLGQGLATCRRLVAALSGSIAAESQPGSGTRLTVRVPARAETGAATIPAGEVALADPDAARPELPRLRGRVLLADDSRDNQRVFTYYLEQLGLSVAVAENGRQAAERGRSEPFDLVLMDIQMPELDGYAATRLLRESGYRQPIVALTARALIGDAERCLAAGCDDYLRKPVGFDRFTRTLSRLLGHPVETPATEAGLRPVFTAVGGEAPLRSEFAGDADFMELVRDYLDGLPARVNELRRGFAQGQLGRVSRVAHVLRGNGAMYGYPELSEVAGLLEDALSEGQDSALLDELIGEVEALTRRATRGLEASPPARGAARPVNSGESRSA